MTDYKIIKRCFLDGNIKATGKTAHYFGDWELPIPFSLEIVQYHDDDGYYLFYLDKNGKIQTDTYHDTLQAALDHAKFEFEIPEVNWRDVE